MSSPSGLPTAALGPCPYVDGNHFAAEVLPEWAFGADQIAAVGHLLRQGFRRNGGYWYRPQCGSCQQCIPMRVNTATFDPRDDQRRAAKRNTDLSVVWHERGFDSERQALFRRYQQTIHHEGDNADGADLHLVGDCPGGELHARDEAGTLIAVSIIDRGDDGLSSVYCYYDPDQPKRSLGTFMVLAEIAEAQRQGLPWLYLGYTIDACSKMVYKQRFGPHQRFIDGQWVGPETHASVAP